MRGMTARLGKGFFDPVASPTKKGLRALLWNLQTGALPWTHQRRFHSPLETHDR